MQHDLRPTIYKPSILDASIIDVVEDGNLALSNFFNNLFSLDYLI